MKHGVRTLAQAHTLVVELEQNPVLLDFKLSQEKCGHIHLESSGQFYQL